MELRDALVIDAVATLGDLVFKKFDREVAEYKDGERTDKVRGYKFKVESSRLMDVIEVTVVDPTINYQVLEENPENFYNQKVQFSGLKISPYIQRSGNFSSLGWSITADSIKINAKAPTE